MEESYANKAGTAIVAERGGIAVVVTEVKSQTPALTPARPHTLPKDDDIARQFFDPVAYDIAAWGEDNIFPQRVLNYVKQNESLSSMLDWKLRAISSAELQYGEWVYNEDTKTSTFVQQSIPEIEDFLECNNIRDTYIPETLKDLLYLGNISPEIITNRDRSKMASLKRIDASFFRKKLQNKRTRRTEQGWVYADWDGIRGLLIEEDATRVRVFEPRNNDVEIIRDNSSLYKFIYPCSYPKLGELYYSMAAWHPIINSGWLELLTEIPKIKNKYFENSLKLKYHIEIDYRYWEHNIPNWQTLTDPQKVQKKQEKAEEIAQIFADTEGTGKAITTDILFDNINREQWSLIKVTPLKNMLEDGILNEDSREAISHLCLALGIDSTLVTTPGKSIGGGSGSDKRLAWNILMMLTKIDQRITLKPLELCMKYNGHANIRFRFHSPLMAVLNETSPTNRDMTNE